MRKLLEFFISIFCKPKGLPKNFKPASIFVLRNNDLGDFLLITPLLSELKKQLPNTKIYLGLGPWAQSLAENNPYIDEVIPCPAPWHNKQICEYPANSLKHFFNAFKFSLFSQTTRAIQTKKIELGIDILGSPEGSVFLKSCSIPYRFGVKGYAGGYSGCQKWIVYDESRHIGKSTLQNLDLLKIETKNISTTPEIYLTNEEFEQGKSFWNKKGKKKLIIAPGGGFEEKCWPKTYYKELCNALSSTNQFEIIVVGGKEDISFGQDLERFENIRNICRKTSLRETCAIVSQANQVICNSSFMMHCAAAFEVPALVLLGEWYDSTELHKKQWGHNSTLLLGKEVVNGKTKIASPDEVMLMLQKLYL